MERGFEKQKVIVCDIGGTLMEYRGMPLSWIDFYKDGFRYVRKEFGLNITDEDIDQSYEVLKDYNPRIHDREIEYSSEIIFSEATAHWKGNFILVGTKTEKVDSVLFCEAF